MARAMRPSAPAWADVKLRCNTGELPEPGTELVTPTGRRYQVIGARGRTLRCIVLPPDAPVQGRVLDWQWAGRRRSC